MSGKTFYYCIVQTGNSHSLDHCLLIKINNTRIRKTATINAASNQMYDPLFREPDLFVRPIMLQI